jgi:DeoR family fructose operon transcriptional repressor
MIEDVQDYCYICAYSRSIGDLMGRATRDRREFISAQVLKYKHVTVRDLASQAGVSEATVRRDLRELSTQGRVELFYGGAGLPRMTDYSFQSKSMRNVEAKRTIGSLAAELVSEGDHVLLDSGSTCFQMVQGLKRKRGLSIMLNSSRLVEELAAVPDIKLIVLGGRYRPHRMDTVGPLAHATLDQLRGFVTFIGADGLSMEFGPAASDIESADLYRLAVRNARETILLVDHTKFRAPSLFKVTDWESVSQVVTDRVPEDEWMRFFESNGIHLLCPQAEQGTSQSSHGGD